MILQKVSVSKAKIARYYLRALQKTKDGSNAPLDLTLEHVLDKEYNSRIHSISEDDHAVYLNRLGNLALLESDPNGAIQDHSFLEKKPILADMANCSLTEDCDSTHWNAADIEKRQKSLADLAPRTWLV